MAAKNLKRSVLEVFETAFVTCMQALVERLPHMGFHVDMDTYRVLIKGCILAGRPEDAHRNLRVMEEEGHQV